MPKTVCVCVCLRITQHLRQVAAGILKFLSVHTLEMFYVYDPAKNIRHSLLGNDYCGISKLVDATISHMFCNGYVLIV